MIVDILAHDNHLLKDGKRLKGKYVQYCLFIVTVLIICSLQELYFNLFTDEDDKFTSKYVLPSHLVSA